MANEISIQLNHLQEGDKAIITGFSVPDVPSKFYSIGIFPGAGIEVYRILPFGGAVCIYINENNTKIAVSRREAGWILTNKKKNEKGKSNSYW